MKLIDLTVRLNVAALAEDPLDRVVTELKTLAPTVEDLAADLAFLSGRGTDAEQAFFRAPHVSLFKIRFDPGRRTPPHDHGAWAAILLLQGRERNTLYRTDPAGVLVETGQVVLAPGEILPMPADAIHVAECISDEPAVGFHVYGGDEVTLPRRVWHPETFAEHEHNEERYGQFANIASAAAAGSGT